MVTGVPFCKRENNMRFLPSFGFERAFGQAEAAFLQNAHRRDVMSGHTGAERPPLFQAKKRGERFAGNASSPKCAVEPIADLAFPVAQKTSDVPRYLPIGDDSLCQSGLIRQDLCPMLVELSPFARTEYNHRDGHGISLVFKKERQVGRCDIAQ